MLHAETGVPVVMLVERTAMDPGSGRMPTSEDRLAFGERLIRIMAEAVLPR